MIEQIVLKNKMFVAFLASCPPLDYTRYVNEAGCSIRYTSYTARISNNLINLGFVKQTAKSIDPFVAMTKHQHITTTVYIMKLEMERSLSVLNIRETLRLSDINHKENISYSTVTAVSQHQRRYSTRRMSANVIPVSKRPLESRLHALPVDRSAYRPSVSSAMQGVHVRNSEVGR